ncbi:hypothetical protein [Piscinibacter gummiphilus]|uniref:Uncharacterized protein n=1 Tax=Piscinibacter gummiphilus TaxID=946333 RepID=A0ABZ0CUS7_9BURK|nr:hypothetical protein [Piscinibacter gummiphilus]WOB08718.1 hypothetical protein RXV79_01370 [Piscinibacter gummiphilus]
MLALKLLLVPTFLLMLSLAGRRWGPQVAGWLAGLPVVTGPILFFLAVERGTGFASSAATLSLSAVLASVSFSLAFAHAGLRGRWWPALLAGLVSWAVMATLLARWPLPLGWALALALGTLWMAARLFPAEALQPSARTTGRGELLLRMATGAGLTVGVTAAAAALGPAWSGLLAVFPVLGIVLAVFSHRSQGGGFAAALLRAMATGLYAFVAFCFVLALALPGWGTGRAFAAAVAASLAVQVATRGRVAVQRPRPT